MKKLFYLLSASILAFSCTPAETTDPNTDEDTDTAKYMVLTFEDNDQIDWSSLIDNKEYGGDLLYAYDADGYARSTYSWYDEGNTELASEIGKAPHWQDTDIIEGALWNGGVAVSNYYLEVTTKENVIPYTNQLSISYIDDSKKCGHNGSDNFAIVNKGNIFFKDEVARTIDHAYVAATSYWTYTALYGNDSSAALAATDYCTIVATADTGATAKFDLAKGGKIAIDGWEKWDLSSLGEVTKVTFSFESSVANDWGITIPEYFAIDDIAIAIE